MIKMSVFICVFTFASLGHANYDLNPKKHECFANAFEKALEVLNEEGDHHKLEKRGIEHRSCRKTKADVISCYDKHGQKVTEYYAGMVRVEHKGSGNEVLDFYFGGETKDGKWDYGVRVRYQGKFKLEDKGDDHLVCKFDKYKIYVEENTEEQW